MKKALVLTTVNVPTVLALYRKCDPDVHFYIMGDRKTPDTEVVKFLEGVPNHSYYGYDWQAKLGYKCHDLIGSNCIQRRNIGFLEALKHKADIIVSIDDDNIPTDLGYFSAHHMITWKYSGVKVSGQRGWFDPGQLLVPPVVQRGFPIQVKHRPRIEAITNAKVGVVSGLILGDSDMDAYTRIGKAPVVNDVSALARSGCVVDPGTYTIFNSQNSSICRDLLPAWFMMPGIGRYDDVYASLIVQRVMRERNYHVHLGQPLVWQERNKHDPIVDLRAEVEGMAHVKDMADLLDSILLVGNNTVDDTRKIYQTLLNCEFLPKASVEAGLAWLLDCETVT